MQISLDLIDVERRPSGSGSRRNCRAKPVTLAAADATTGSLSKRFFGLRARARRGAICRKRSAGGSPSKRAFGAGRRSESGSGVSKRSARILISNMSSSMARSSGSISMAPAQKGDSKSGHRPLARRLDHQDHGLSRRPPQSHSLRPVAWSASRQHRRRTFDHRSRFCGVDRRRPSTTTGCAPTSMNVVLQRSFRPKPIAPGASPMTPTVQMRHLVENFFCSLKTFRRFATGYRKDGCQLCRPSQSLRELPR